VRQALAALVIVTAVACGESRKETPGDTAIAFSASEDTMHAAREPGHAPVDTDVGAVELGGSPTLVLKADSAAGDAIFRRGGNCFTCHGVRGEGVPSLGPSLADSVWLHSTGSVEGIQRTIAEGVAVPKISPTLMPAFSRSLSPAALFRVAAYVYTLSHPGAAVADTSRSVLDTTHTPPSEQEITTPPL
jgi:mono/diheme cytochrome c family protein